MGRVRDALVWGVVGGLAFLVLLQGYELLTGVRVGPGPKVGVALLVTAGAAGASYVLGPRLAPDRRV